MRRMLLFLAAGSALTYAGFFPVTATAVVTEAEGNRITLSRSLGTPGVSGALIHSFRGIDAMTGYVVQTDTPKKAERIALRVIAHDKLPGIKTPPQKGDKIIGGYLYRNVMALAPDMATYRRIVDAYPSKTWFHPDLLAAFLSSKGEATPTPALLREFALTYQIGLFYIVKKDEAVLYDPVSQRVIARKPAKSTAKSAKFPFFMRFEKFRTGIFSDSSEAGGNYYDVMEQFQ